MNKQIICGNLGADPETKTTTTGQVVTKLRIAVNERSGSGDDAKEHTEWFSVTTFGRQAETCAKYLKKGSQVLVEGRQKTSRWNDKEDPTKEHFRTECIAQRVQFLSSPQSQSQPTNQAG